MFKKTNFEMIKKTSTPLFITPKTLLITFIACVLLFTCLPIGCGIEDDDKGGGDGPITEREDVFNLSSVTDEGGEASVGFNVAPGTSKISVTAAVEDERYVRFELIRSGDGTDYLSPGREQITLADEYFRYINAATIPSRAQDPAVNDNERYTVTAKASETSSDDPILGETVLFTVHTKVDPDLNRGVMRVNLFFVGDVGQEQTSKDATLAALPEFERIYQDRGNIRLDVAEYDITGPVVLPLPIEGDPFYTSAGGQGISPSVNLFIGGDIEGLGDSGETLGIAGGIPGPPRPSERTGVAISIFAGAGADGIFSAEDIRLLGETMAHESGHFMGLFHPVDFSGSVVSATDPLPDTDSCRFISECLSNDSLTRNLMFTSPVPNGQGGFIPQNDLTSDQRAVLNRYIVVD